MNEFIQYYTEHGISPVSQDIQDFQNHMNRRSALYRTLGLTPKLFQNRELLEVGPGSGYNSIVSASFGPARYTLLEPNPTGFQAMLKLFEKHHQNHQLKKEALHFHNLSLENYPGQESYDIVLCEGLMAGLNNQENFLGQLDKRLRSGGILVLTCSDPVSMLFESCRRYLARLMLARADLSLETGDDSAKKSSRLEKQVDLLEECFSSHLQSLKGRSRPIRDWILDNLLNPAADSASAHNAFSLLQALNILGKHYYFYHSSPNIFHDARWYKNLPASPQDYNAPVLQQYYQFLHTFVDYRLEITPRFEQQNQELLKASRAFADFVCTFQPLQPQREKALELLKQICANLREYEETAAALIQARALIEKDELQAQDINEARDFAAAFGRGMQYISLEKTFDLK